MKSLFNFSSTINTPKPRSTPNIWAIMAQQAFQSRNLSVLTSLLTISGAIGIGVTVNPQRTLAGACVGVYSTRNGEADTNQGFIGYFNPINNSYVTIATYTGGENINSIATQPSTGNLFFINRNTRRVQVYNINTGQFTQLAGTIPLRTIRNPSTGELLPVSIIGATFTADGKFYVYYNDKVLYDIDPATGSVRTGTSAIFITGIPGRTSGLGTVNGDIAVGTDGTFYAIGEINDTESQIYRLTVSGTTATATAVNNTNPISGTTAVNGLAIDPLTRKFYISSSSGTYELDTTTKVATQLTSTVGTNDLAACGSPAPDLPTITKAFNPTTITTLSASSTLTLTLGNTNSVPIYLTQALVDNFQSGLTVSNPNGLSGTCTTISGNTPIAAPGSSSITIPSGFKIPAGGCTVSVKVTASGVGTYVNTIAAGALTTIAGDNVNAASSTLVVGTTISGTLYEDTDGGDDLDATEPKLPANITVKLLDTNNNIIKTATTDINGAYTFTGVIDGSYKIQVDTADTDIPTRLILGTTNNLLVTVSGSAVSNQNFGFDPTYNVSGTLYKDNNNNNNNDSEPALAANVTVTLYKDNNSNNAIDAGEQVGAPVVTNSSGQYSFTKVLAGTYKIKVDTADSDIPSGYLLGTPNDLTATVTNVNVTGQNFGFDPPTYSISGTLYEDRDRDNTLDAGEPSLPANVTVKLLDTTGTVTLATTTTNAAGQYTFNNIIAGSYIVFVDTSDTDIPSGYTLGTTNNISVIVSTASVSDRNFGFDIPSNPNVLLVKRITAVDGQTTTRNGDNLATYKDESTNPYDDNDITVTNPSQATPADTNKWFNLNSFLIGGTNGGQVQPNGEVEYTIYYLSTGDTTANKVLICDRIPANTTFIPTAFNDFATKNPGGLALADRGIIWQYNGITQSLTNVKDGDGAEYLASGIDPTIKYPGIKCDGTNTNGVVVVNLGNLPKATAPGNPTNSYGFVRFRAKVK